ncbi:beta-glucosidase 18-like [Silene latifolia]|uniref:beta-glucosidase 18-like n=1 Tax=Silene latifolia TaxID=37657 RepID=UPI003D77BD6E
MVQRSMFPKDFIFGVATSAYQAFLISLTSRFLQISTSLVVWLGLLKVEGAYLEDGKGLSNWDVFSHTSGNTVNNENGDVADDHYHRYEEDFNILDDLGVDAYRFSISWTRILPRGRFGKINPSGITFYNKIIDNLLLKGIEPFVTIHHFDYPQELEERFGAWLSPLMQDDFVHFAKICFEEFGDRVKHWITINEPNIFSLRAYVQGNFPPEHCSPPFGNCSTGNSDVEPLIVVHNMLLSHAKAAQLYRHQFQPKQHGYLGIALCTSSFVPYRDDKFSRRAVERAYANEVAWIIDPLVYGNYPSLMRKYHGKELPKFTKDEVKLLKESVDFVGLNHYTTFYAVDCFHYSSECSSQDNRAIKGFVKTTGFRDGIPIGEQGNNPRFFTVPQGMELTVDYIKMRYPDISIYITENGYAPPTLLNVPEILHDVKRVEYLRTYIAALGRAIRKGAKVKGYFAWSFMDNFEWSDGYEPTYGLYYVDRTTQKRIPKLSAYWYAGLLGNHSPRQYLIANQQKYEAQ